MNRARTLLLLSVLAVVTSPLVRAEVGVFAKNPDMDERISIYVLSITDGPDPWGFWQLVSGSPRHVPLNPEGYANQDGKPTMVLHPTTGKAIVAWARNGPQSHDVVYSVFGSGSWSDPVVLAGAAEEELDPWLTVAGDGTVHLFYWVAGPIPSVWHREAPADLSAWTAPTLVSSPSESACRPSAIEVDGDLLVVYERHDFGYGQTPRQVVLARRQGGSFVPEIVAVSQNPSELRPELHRHEGTVWVDWVDAPLGQGGEVAWTRRDAGGGWEPLRYEPFDTVEERDWFVRGAVRAQAIE